MEQITCPKCNKEFSDPENMVIIASLEKCGVCALND
jgi:hypothetical protein